MLRYFVRRRLAAFGFATALAASICLRSEAAPPTQKTYDITSSGAVADGTTLNTSAIQSAIDKCATAGGGTVLIPQGDFLSGAIFLKPGVNLRLDKGAVLQGSTNIADYPEMETRIEGHFQVWVAALINADGVDHLRIDGDGAIQGGGKFFWDEFLTQRAANKALRNLDVKRPRTIFIENAKDVQITGLAVRDSGFWNLHLFRCQDVVVEKMDIRSPLKAPSTDGIDVDSCQNVTIRGCTISVDDDNIALKGSKGTSALDDKTILPDENIYISDCTFGLGNAALTLGSEATTVRDVVMENCKLAGKEKNTLLALKLRPDTQQDYENITVRNITVDNPAARLISIERWTQYYDLQGKPAPSQTVNGVTLSDVTGKLNGFGSVDGPETSDVQNVTFKNMNIVLKNPDVRVKNVKALKFENVTINGAVYPEEK